ncbi:MAG TPA: NAD-dependent epimerase/dehydratase family protein [Candidatus Deferrimicrobium sp.]|nr:NAD-dependent epimerase/dehydratase family protein [Candidatus Deferrimicrobium sp.]
MNKQTVFLKDRHVGVTGANGFLGSHICGILRQKEAIIHAFIYPGTDIRNIDKFIANSGGQIQELDITKPQSIVGKLNNIDYLFQIAGTTAEWDYPMSRIFDINYHGVLNIHTYARKAGVKRTVHTSTMAANGSCPAPYPALTSEDAPWDMQFTGPYSVSKYLGDRIAQKFHQPGVYETIRIRPHQILGWWDTGPSAPGKLVLQAMRGGVPGYIDQVTQIVHVQDVAEAHVAAMERGTSGSVYNIASEKPIRAYDFLRYVCKVAQVKPPPPIPVPKGVLRIAAFWLENIATLITHKPPLLTRGNARVLYKNTGTSIERAKKELGFKPRPWQEAVKEAVRWFKEGYKKRES